MVRLKKNTCSFAVLMMCSWSCNFQEVKSPDHAAQEANLNSEKGPSDFQLLMSNLFGPSCIACHNSGKSAAGVNLETCESIVKGNARGRPLVVPGRAESSAIVAAIASGRMPPGGNKVSADLMALLSSWIAAGATEQTWTAKKEGGHSTSTADQSPAPGVTPTARLPVATPTPTPVPAAIDPVPTQVVTQGTTYLTVKAELFTPKCMGCHSGEFAEGGVDLSSRDLIVGPPQPGTPANLVVQSNPEASLLFKVLQTQVMPPQGMPSPSAAAIARLREWIMTPEMP